jgi:predicted transcriptional regulator
MMGGVVDSGGTAGRLPLSGQLSHVLVAFTVELDNEFEHQMPHRTTKHGSTPGHAGVPWLVSYPMWVHCLRYIPEEGIRAGELVRASGLTSKTMQHVIKRLAAWWGYLRVGQPDPGLRGAGSAASRLVRPSAAGRQAQTIWQPLEAAVEGRWRDRFGSEAIGRLRDALGVIVEQVDTELPDYLPLGEPRLRPRPSGREAPAPATLGLPALVSKVLLALALDFEQQSDLALGIATADHVSRLAIGANVLRVIDEQGVRVSQVPARTGLAKMAVDNQLGSLEDGGYIVVGPDPGGSRFKVAIPTAKGLRAQQLYGRWTGEVEERFGERFGPAACPELRQAVGSIVCDDGADSPFRQGMDPYPDGWRAQLSRPEVLPDYPVVSMRGGFPDGS